MTSLSVYRSAGRTWAVAVLAVPFFLLGLDLLLIPRLFPQYQRRVDWLADQMSLDRITSNGPEEAWGLVFLVAAGGLLLWSLKELLFPREILAVDEEGVSFAGTMGPAGGRVVVPRSEILEVAPAVLREFGEETPAVGFRFEFPERLPSNPWGGLLVDDFLFIRTRGLSVRPYQVSVLFTAEEGHTGTGYVVDLEPEQMSVTPVEGDPSDHFDQKRAFAARSRIFVGAALLLAGVLVAFFLLISSVDTNAFYLIPTVLVVGGGLTALLAGRDFLESS